MYNTPFGLNLTPSCIVSLGDRKSCEVFAHPSHPYLLIRLFGLETMKNLSLDGVGFSEPLVSSYKTPVCDCCEDGKHKPYWNSEFTLEIKLSIREPTGHFLIPALNEGASDFCLYWLTTPSGSLVYGNSRVVFKPSQAKGESLLA